MAKRKASLTMQPRITWYVIQVNRDGTEERAGQFTSDYENPKRALQFVRENCKAWIAKGAKSRVSRTPLAQR